MQLSVIKIYWELGKQKHLAPAYTKVHEPLPPRQMSGHCVFEEKLRGLNRFGL